MKNTIIFLLADVLQSMSNGYWTWNPIVKKAEEKR